MPNWCNNTLTVTGEPEKVAEFVEQMKGIESDSDGNEMEVALDFNAVMPMPRVLKNRKSPSDDGSITWYDWQTENWGIKWGACSSHISEHLSEEGKVVYFYDTAWGPAIDWLETLFSYFPWLDFTAEWEECGMGFAGEMHSTKGVATEPTDWAVEWDDENEEVRRVD